LTVTEGAKAIAKIFDVSPFRLVHEYVTWVRLRDIVAHLRDKPCLGHIEVAAALRENGASMLRTS
jgi:hypothetical protein